MKETYHRSRSDTAIKLMCLIATVAITSFPASSQSSSKLDRTVFVILSQDAHDKTAEATRQDLQNVLRKDGGVRDPHVALLHKDLPSHGGWTIFPILTPLLKDYHNLADWFVFLEEGAAVDTNIFAEIITEHNPEGITC